MYLYIWCFKSFERIMSSVTVVEVCRKRKSVSFGSISTYIISNEDRTSFWVADRIHFERRAKKLENLLCLQRTRFTELNKVL